MTISADYAAAFSALVADARLVRKEGAMAKPPAKGIRRSALVGGWLAIHIFELVVLAVYGAFGRGPLHAAWWLLTSLLAGILYVRVVFSNPGFVDAALLQRLAEEVGLAVTVAGTDASRGLLADVEATLPRMQELLPVDEQTVCELPVTTAYDPTRAACGRARVAPTDSSAPSSSTDAVEVELEEVVDPGELLHVDAAKNEEEEEKTERLKRALAFKPRIVGIVEAGQEEAMAELERQRQERLNKPLGLEDYFRRARPPPLPFQPPRPRASAAALAAPRSGFCEPADMHLPIRGKYTKKHGRVVAKFDHYCYMLGNSVGELNHGLFYRFLFVQVSGRLARKRSAASPDRNESPRRAGALWQVTSIWLGKWLLNVAYLDWGRRAVWIAANAPLLVLNLLTWVFGLTLTMLLLTHTFMACTSSTTYEWLKLDKLDYMKGFYEFSFPFSEGLCTNLAHFCCPKGIKLWRRPPPESDWPESFWRNRYYSCFG